MSPQISQHTAVASGSATALDPVGTRPILLTVDQFSERNPAFSAAAIRNLIFKADVRQSSRGAIQGNGLIEAGAVLRIGRKVLIDEGRFYDWVREANRARE